MQSSPRIEELKQKFHENPRRYFAPLANEYRKAGDSEQAIAICRAHLAQQPGHMSGHVVYGQALYDAGRMDEAGVVFQQALALDPENVIVLRRLGDIARQRGDVEEARSWYDRALDGDPHDAEIAAYLAELTEPLTIAPHAEVISDVPADGAAVEAEALAGAESEGLAAESSQMAQQTEPESESVPEPESPPAEAATEPATRKTPATESAPIVTRTLAELYLQQGYIEPALEIYRQLAEQEPDDTRLQARIDELSGEPDSETAAAEPEVAADQLWDSADSWGDRPFTDAGERDEIFGLAEDLRESPQGTTETPPPVEKRYEPEPESELEPEWEAEAEPVTSATRLPLTVREFFATLGSARPPTDDPERSGGEAYAIADDAFANLFAGMPANADDSRAAAVLSGAVAHGAPVSTPPASPSSARPSEVRQNRESDVPAQESDDDIRRFREWLDEVAES